MNWKKGRGKLGVFEPLLGTWVTESDSEMGQVRVTRTFTKTLGGKYVQLNAMWQFASRNYEETALFGVDSDKRLKFWSFTSDGKNSQGCLEDASDIHPDAIGFTALMPAGTARQVYFPASEGEFNWVVESKTKKGWNRFLEHNYKPL